MSSESLELEDARRVEYHLRWEAIETLKARELARMTEARAQQIIQSLGAVEGWRNRPDWSGLVEARHFPESSGLADKDRIGYG